MTKILDTRPDLFYFGKFPARGDFVKSSNGGPIIAVFDQWISQTLEMMSGDPHWKIAYDNAAPIDFTFIGTRAKSVVAGSLVSSCDTSQRRFPFTLATRFEVDAPLSLVGSAPLMLHQYWLDVRSAVTAIKETQNDQDFHLYVSRPAHGLNVDHSAIDASFKSFGDRYTVEALESLLAEAGHSSSIRQSVLGLGMLLQPIITHGATNLQKGLVFPLPEGGSLSSLVASFWLRLVVGFLSRHEFELAVFVTRFRNKPILLIGFVGASPRALMSLLCPDATDDYHVELNASAWVEDYVETDAGLRKLSNYMKHPQLSLNQAIDTFNEVFLGL